MAKPSESSGVARIRALNDLLRTTGIGGRIVLASGVSGLPPNDLRAVIDAVRSFDSFSPDNDPYGEHDCAVLSVGDMRFIWKIDYYDGTLTVGSADASDPSIILMVAAALALIIANSPFGEPYQEILHAYLGPLSIEHWVNDDLMALFFLLGGLEIKRETLDGQLASWSRRILPGVAAAGGMVVPALIYFALNAENPATVRG